MSLIVGIQAQKCNEENGEIFSRQDQDDQSKLQSGVLKVFLPVRIFAFWLLSARVISHSLPNQPF